MSMKFRDRDFKKNPLTRADTQVYFNPDCPEEAPYKAQQHYNAGNKLDSAKIMSVVLGGGVITHSRNDTARYIDATVFNDFRENMSVKAKADEAFNAIPEDVRKNFGSQQEFVQYCLDEKNVDQLREWGLAAPLKTAEPSKPVEVVIVPVDDKKPA